MHSGCWADVISKMETGAQPWPALLWAHKWDEPVGKVTYAQERGNGLYVKGRFNLNTTRGKDAFEDVRFGTVKELSVGFLTDPKTGEYFDSKGVRHVTKVSRWPDVSFVLVGASPDTRVMSIKDSYSQREFSLEALLGQPVEDIVSGLMEEIETDRIFHARRVEKATATATENPDLMLGLAYAHLHKLPAGDAKEKLQAWITSTESRLSLLHHETQRRARGREIASMFGAK
jgi:HK97 family phage prohead protease